MKNESRTPTAPPAPTSEKPGFFKRLVAKLDHSLKQKADERSTQPCCGGSDGAKGKGGKCC